MADQSMSSTAARPVDRPLIELAGVDKTYRTGSVEYQALRGVDLAVSPGEMVAIVGSSGSGKSTTLYEYLLCLISYLGRVTVDGKAVGEMSEEELAVWRGTRVGIVFQFFQLLPTLTAQENAALPMELARLGSASERVERTAHNLELVGLAGKHDRVPAELSGGEQQRVAIARALACAPVLLLGDEPTGNLDSETASRMFDLLRQVNEQGMTVLYVTHDPYLASQANRVITVRDGQVAED